MAGDGEEAGLAADFVDLAAQGFFFVGRSICEFRKIKNWEGRYFVGLGVLTSTSERTLSQGGVGVNLGVRGTSGGHGFILGEFGVWT